MDTIISTVKGLGTAGYVSTLSLISTTNSIGASISSFSTAFGPGGTNMNTILSTVKGLGTAGYVSTLSLTSSLISTTNFIGLTISSFSTAFGPPGGGSVTTANLVSSIQGLGTSGYVSTTALGAYLSSISTSYRNEFNTVTSIISALTVSSLTFGSGDGYLAMPDIRPTAMSTLVTQTSSLQAFNLQIGATSSVTAIQFYGLQGNFNNTVLAERSIGVGSQEFLIFKGSSTADQVRIQTTGIFEIETGVSGRLWSTVTQNATPAFVIDINSNVGIQTASPGAPLDVVGIARANTFSSQQLFVSSINGSGFLTNDVLVSSLIGLGSLGYVSTASLISTTNYVNSAISSFSTAFGPPGGGSLTIGNLNSTVQGLGSAGYVSTLTLNAALISTTNFVGASISSFSTAFGPPGGGSLTIGNLNSTVQGLGSAGYVSTLSLFSAINTAISSFSSALGTVGSGGTLTIPNNLSTMAIFTSSLLASTITASTIFTSSISGSLSQFTALSSLSLYVSSFYTATRQATPMFIVF